MQLSKTEEELMNHLWRLEKAFLKELLAQYSEPKPANTTIATLLKRMADKSGTGMAKRNKPKPSDNGGYPSRKTAKTCA